jgi:hypothetical protein
MFRYSYTTIKWKFAAKIELQVVDEIFGHANNK